jgi:hypothetical protein
VLAYLIESDSLSHWMAKPSENRYKNLKELLLVDSHDVFDHLRVWVPGVKAHEMQIGSPPTLGDNPQLDQCQIGSKRVLGSVASAIAVRGQKIHGLALSNYSADNWCHCALRGDEKEVEDLIGADQD